MKRPDYQQPLPPMLLADQTQADPVRPKCTPADEASSLASDLFDVALTEAQITTAEAAYLLKVSESLVRRMRSKDARECASFPQMLRLPLAFHLSLHRVMSRRLGLGKHVVAELLDVVGRIALVTE